jgi:ATP-binding cassette, subfamily C, bacterial CydCD
MKPVDPRLVRAAPSLRGYLARLGVLGAVNAGLVVAQATLIVDVVVRGFVDRSGLAGVSGDLWTLAAVVGGRAGVGWLVSRAGERASPRVIADLRAALLAALTCPPGRSRSARPGNGELAVTAGAGLDGMDAYLTRFLPALALVVAVPPVVLVRLAFADVTSTAVLAATLPGVPLFMTLVGMATRARTDRQWAVLGRLAGHFLDVVEGLPTLRVFNRAKAQSEVIRQVTDSYRVQTMAALRMAFLSSLVLELFATLSVALVAVSVGLRVVSGSLDLRDALLVLLLAPELYLPLRQVGTQYHATMSGLTAAAAALDLVDAAPGPSSAALPAVPSSFNVVELDDVSVRHPGRRSGALERVSLTIRSGEVVVLVGPSGAGKSSLLALLRGALAPTTGRVLLDGCDLAGYDAESWRSAVAWMPQRPRVVTGMTVADEVGLGRPAATAAQIEAAITRAGAPPGDRLVGEDGAALSTGERRRVALARVLVRQAPLVLLDEPTESLDAAARGTVAAAIASLRGRATVVLVTHADAVAGLADRVVYLADGRIAGERAQATHSVSALGASPLPANAPSRALAAPPASVKPRSRGDRWRLARVFRPAWPGLGLGVLAGGAAFASATGLTATAAWMISRAAQHPPVLTLMVAAVAVRAFGLGKAVFRYGERLVSHDAALRGLARLRSEVFARLIPLAPAGLVLFRRGDLLRRFTADTDGVGESLVRGIGPTLSAVLAGGGAVLLVGLVLPPAGAVLAAGLLTAAILAGPVSARLGAAAAAAAAAGRDRRDAGIVAFLDGLAELTAYGAAQARLADLRAHDTDIARLAVDPRRSPAWGNATGTFVAGLTTVVVAAFGVAAVRDGHLPGVMLAVVILTSLAAFEPLAGLGDAFTALRRTRGESARIFDVLDATPPVVEPTHPRPLPSGPLDIRLEQVSLRYGPGEPEVLTGLDLELPAGRRVALVGPSGAGKSSVATLLLRFLDPTSGRVLLGGVDLRDVAGDDLHRAVSGMTQDAHVFDATLRENLMIARPGATPGQLERILHEVGLADWTRTLADGLDTRVGPHGERMSGGQRQRLLLARALLADPAVLLLDEPTAHLDAATEAAVMRQILDATRGRTVLLITHRRTGLEELDAVVELTHDGRISAGPAIGAAA